MIDRSNLTCRELIEFIARYLDHELAPDARTEFERHLIDCPSCVAYLDSYRRTVALSKASMATGDPIARVPERLLRAVHAARTRTD